MFSASRDVDLARDPALLLEPGGCHLDPLQLLQLRLEPGQPADLTRPCADGGARDRRPANDDEEEHQVVEPVVEVVVGLVDPDENADRSRNTDDGPSARQPGACRIRADDREQHQQRAVQEPVPAEAHGGEREQPRRRKQREGDGRSGHVPRVDGRDVVVRHSREGRAPPWRGRIVEA